MVFKLWIDKNLNSKYGGEILFVQDVDWETVDM